MSFESDKFKAEALVPEDRNAPLVCLIVLFALLLYGGLLYVDRCSGDFNPLVYAPYHSVDELVAAQPSVGGDVELIRKGKVLFSANCAVCHMENGSGNPQNGCPPLAGSEWVTTPGVGRVARIISKGLNGPIKVMGKDYGTGMMIAVGDAMLGDEKQKTENIAAIISYIHSEFGNKAPAVKPEAVARVREQIKDRINRPFTAEELLAFPENE